MASNLVTSIIIRARNLAGAAITAARRQITGLTGATTTATASTAASTAAQAGHASVLGRVSAAANSARTKIVLLFAAFASIGGLKRLISGFSSLDDAIRSAAAVTGEFWAAFSEFEVAANKMGETTQFTSTQAARALQKLAMSGLSVSDSIGALPAVLNLAAASGADLATSADTLTNIMSQYGFAIDDLSDINDKLVKTFTSSNTSLQEIGFAFGVAGPIAKSAEQDFSEMSAILGIMANNGFKGERGGTALRGALARLLVPTIRVKSALSELSLNINDSTGKMRPLVDIIQELSEKGASTQQILKLFGVEAGPAMAALVSQGTDSIRKLTEEINNSGGTAKRVSEEMNSGLGGTLKLLESAADGVAKSMGKGMSDQVIASSKKMIAIFGEVKDSAVGLASSFTQVVAPIIIAFAETIKTTVIVIDKYKESLGSLVLAYAALKLGSIIAAVVSYATAAAAATGATGLLATGVSALSAAWSRFTVVLLANPIGASIAALALLAKTVYDVKKSYDDLDDAKADVILAEQEYQQSLKETHDEILARKKADQEAAVSATLLKVSQSELAAETENVTIKTAQSTSSVLQLIEAQRLLQTDLKALYSQFKNLSDDAIDGLIIKAEQLGNTDPTANWNDVKSDLISEKLKRIGIDLDVILDKATDTGQSAASAFTAFAGSSDATTESLNRLAEKLIKTAKTKGDIDLLNQAFKNVGFEIDTHPKKVEKITDKIIEMGGALDPLPGKWQEVGRSAESAGQAMRQAAQESESLNESQAAQQTGNARADHQLELRDEFAAKDAERTANRGRPQFSGFSDSAQNDYQSLNDESLRQLDALMAADNARATRPGRVPIDVEKVIESLAKAQRDGQKQPDPAKEKESGVNAATDEAIQNNSQSTKELVSLAQEQNQTAISAADRQTSDMRDLIEAVRTTPAIVVNVQSELDALSRDFSNS